MSNGQAAPLHFRLPAEIQIGPAANEIIAALVRERRIGWEAEVRVHFAIAAAAGEEVLNDCPGHGRRLGQHLGEIEAAPNGAPRIGLRTKRFDLLATNLFALVCPGGGDWPRLQEPALAIGPGPLDVARLTEELLDFPAQVGEHRELVAIQTELRLPIGGYVMLAGRGKLDRLST